MTNEQFKAWRAHMGLTQMAAGNALGVSKVTIELYERGMRRDSDRRVEIPKSIELACAALALGITHYDGPQQA